MTEATPVDVAKWLFDNVQLAALTRVAMISRLAMRVKRRRSDRQRAPRLPDGRVHQHRNFPTVDGLLRTGGRVQVSDIAMVGYLAVEDELGGQRSAGRVAAARGSRARRQRSLAG